MKYRSVRDQLGRTCVCATIADGHAANTQTTCDHVYRERAARVASALARKYINGTTHGCMVLHHTLHIHIHWFTHYHPVIVYSLSRKNSPAGFKKPDLARIKPQNPTIKLKF